MVRHITVNEKIINIIKNLYKSTNCCVTKDKKLTEWFALLVGLRRGCLLSPTLFNIFLKFVMQEIESMPDEFFFLTDENLKTNVKYVDDTTLMFLIFFKS